MSYEDTQLQRFATQLERFRRFQRAPRPEALDALVLAAQSAEGHLAALHAGWKPVDTINPPTCLVWLRAALKEAGQ